MKKLLFSFCAVLVILGCGGNIGDLPCWSCEEYSSSSSFSFVSCTVSGVSSDSAMTCSGQTYGIVKIGNQTWMAENLNYDPGTGNSACYNNQPDNCVAYGRLYDWSTAMGPDSSTYNDSAKHQGICPSGWHIPNNAEWDELFLYVDNENNGSGSSSSGSPYSSYTAGRYLKATSGWNSDSSGTDQYGFSALPGGYANPDGTFKGIGEFGDWWSTSEYDSGVASYSYAYYFYMSIDRSVRWYYNYKSAMFFVRCLRDREN